MIFLFWKVFLEGRDLLVPKLLNLYQIFISNDELHIILKRRDL